tara:strand:+ start:1133 stop:2152 length:1020 start_codon:yes stop_codon:yes gene_type:complete
MASPIYFNNMYSTENVKEFTVLEILKSISEYDIFQYYIGSKFKIGTISSPFRNDKNPSFDIFYSPNTVRKVMYKDHGTGEIGSCFDLVMRIYGVSFGQCLNIIDNDFQLNLNPFKTKMDLTKGHVGIPTGVDVSKLQVPCKIRVCRRKWNTTTDKDFWKPFGISASVLNKFNVSPISAVKVNNQWFRYRKDHPVYCYHFGNYIYKIYQPYSKEYKWLTNCSQSVIQGWTQLPKNGEFVIITKSLKDVMVYHALGVPSIAPQAESVIPNIDIIEQLSERFTYVISNYDYDRMGMLSSQKMRKLYGIQPIMFTPEYGSKDASDFVKNNGIIELKEIIDTII